VNGRPASFVLYTEAFAMTRSNKQKLLDLVSRMPDDVSWEEVAHRLELLRHIEIARQQTAVPDEMLRQLPKAGDDVPPQPHLPSVT
jgi:hypothetical protein